MRIILDHSTIEGFKRQFPCSGIPKLQSITFDYAGNGDLVGIEAIDYYGKPLESSTFDGAGLLALTQEYQPERP